MVKVEVEKATTADLTSASTHEHNDVMIVTDTVDTPLSTSYGVVP